MPAASSRSAWARIPAVSINRAATPFTTMASSIASRVVPGISETIARSKPRSALSSDDFPPNAGKSSLLNALLGFERAIVSEIPGTTRDAIEEAIVVNGVAARLIDTAGIRAHADRLEAAGIQRTEHALTAAGVALVVIDGSESLGADAVALLRRTAGQPRVVFFNKSDL